MLITENLPGGGQIAAPAVVSKLQQVVLGRSRAGSPNSLAFIAIAYAGPDASVRSPIGPVDSVQRRAVAGGLTVPQASARCGSATA